MNRFVLVAALLPALSAHADVWKRASAPRDPADDLYASLMQKGDDAVIGANSQSIGPTLAVKQIDLAIEAYRGAARLKPKAAEPWFRIGSTIDSYFFDGCDQDNAMLGIIPPVSCSASQVNRTVRAREMVDAWDQFEALSPLDPRINEFLVTRAITRTKLVGVTPKPQPLLEAAAADYQALLDREDGVLKGLYGQGLGLRLVLGNLAETYMMLGDVEKAIAVYRQAKDAGAKSSTLYGLAVALDRDDRTGDAIAVIRAQGVEAFEEFERDFAKGSVFFVPAGEEEYYFALANEAFGNIGESIEHWQAYIRSGAHPKFQPRAKEHLDKLQLRKNVRISVPITPDLGREPAIAPRNPFDPVAPAPPRVPRRPRPVRP